MGGNVNRAVQYVVVEGIEVVGLHHQRKGQGGAKPNGLEDVYGSTWLTAGMGSVVLLWGAAGDPNVELRHLKQPVAEVGPLRIEHDQLTGMQPGLPGSGRRPGGAPQRSDGDHEPRPGPADVREGQAE